ncbi:MAG: dihydroorotase [Deltaproteobacteria bacterium]|nr:dihydroorotase [Deltaproteobacteria bacterium]
MTAEPGTLTIRGGRLALPLDDHTEQICVVEGDLQITGGRISNIGVARDDRGEVIDARGLLVMPGVIDPQVHFREPGLTHKEDLHSGSRACAAGGVTSFLEMPNTKPPTIDRAALDWKLHRARETSLVHYGFFVGATPSNLPELLALEPAEDVAGIKIFMGSSTGTLLVSERADLDRIFAHGRRLIAVHAEDEARLKARAELIGDTADPALHSVIRDAESARIATAVALELSERYQRRLHVLHLSTAEEVELLRERGKGGGRVTAEVTPQHLLLHAPEIYARLGTRAQMNPPLRDARHAAALWRGLREGVLDCVATDHAPHTLAEKAQGYGKAPSGMPGVETSLAAMLDAAHRGLCKVEEVVGWMTEGPRRCYRIHGKGRLELGFDGDVVLVDLARTRTIDEGAIRSRAGWSPFEGVPLTGWPVATFVLGQAVYRDGEIIEARAARPLRFEQGAVS